MDQISVGIDVSKTLFVVAVTPTGERWTSEATPAAIDALVTRLQRLTPAVIVVEATGGYERALVASCANSVVARRSAVLSPPAGSFTSVK